MKTHSFVPHFTQTPNTMFDNWMSVLNGTEYKCLMMIARQTYGWGKESDTISLSQFESGIKTRDGTVVCSGTGCGKTSIVEALKRLVESGLVIKQDLNSYSINLDCDEEAALEVLSGKKTAPITFATPKAKKVFVKPTPQDLMEYVATREKKIDVKKFYNYYESNGWKVGKNKMVDWKATVRSWETRSFEKYTSNDYAHDKNKMKARLDEKREKEEGLKANERQKELQNQINSIAKGKRV